MDDSGGRNTTVCYCCIWKDGQVLFKYTTGNHDTDDMAALCLQSIPPYHRSYFQTVASYTFAFLIDDDDAGFVYFAILRHSLGNSYLLSFLHKLRDEFNKMGSTSAADHQFLPVVRRLVASLERGGGAPTAWPAMNGNAEAGTSSTKAPLLARPSKKDKKKKKKKDTDAAHVVRDIETPDHRLRSSDIQETSSSVPPSHKDYNSSSKIKSSKQIQREKWCRQVRIVLAIDAAVCILLLVIWLVICRGIECIR